MGYKFNAFSGNFDVTVEFLQKIGTVLSPIATGDSLAIYIAGITVPTDGLLLENTVDSTGAAQYSPRIRLKGSGHDGATAVISEWTIENKPISGGTVSSELLISHSLGGAAYTNPITITSGGAIKCSEVLSGLSVAYGDLIFGTATTPTVVSRNTADAYDTFVLNNLNATSTGKILVGQWQSTDRFWFTKEGYLNISSAMNLGAVATDGLVLANTSPALVGEKVQMSPGASWIASAWDDDGAVSVQHKWRAEVLPASGNTVSSTWRLGVSVDGGGFTYPMTLSNAGLLEITNLKIGNGASIYNGGSLSYFELTAGSATASSTLKRNTSTAYTAFTVNQVHASSTGHILDCQWQSVDRFIVFKEGGIQSNAQSAIAMGIAPDASTVLTVGWNNSTMAAGTTAARHLLVGGNITELAGAAITDIVGLYVNTFTITAGAGATVGFTAGIYIPNAPTPGSVPSIGNYSLFIDAGLTRLDGSLYMNACDIYTDTTTGMKIGTATDQKIAFHNATPTVQSTGWGCTNITPDKGLDCDSTTDGEIADVLATLIEELKTKGLIGA